MSGHSKWASIKHKKGAADAKRGKVFTMHAKLIAIAARNGADPDMNPALRAAIDRAKVDNVPNANIDRAIKKGSGADKDAAQYSEIMYEVFGPEGCVFIIDVVTDNKNRALTNVRTIVQKNGGNMGASGSVVWKFDKKAYFEVDAGGMAADEAELSLIDCGADDLEAGANGRFEVYAAPDQLGEVRSRLEAAGFKVEKAEQIWKPKEEMKVSDAGAAKKIVKLIELLEEDEDVNTVSTNVDFDEAILGEL
ncbi:YebC/PmpR family DNA-binding transcriptional regulator [Patescibacteria group bacterium]|nr:YebC/PmpR family DNA-binding transcriptional regulator [Patescibacteria group bacterium]